MSSQILSGDALAANTRTALSDGDRVDGASQIDFIDVSVTITFGGASDAACTLEAYSSMDDTDYDTEPFDSFTIPLNAGNTVIITRRIETVGSFVAFRLFNTSAAQAIAAYSIDIIRHTDQLG